MAQQLLRFPASRQANLRYIAEMRSVYGSMIELPDPDYALANDPYIYNKVMRDPVIASAIFQRLHSVAGNDWHLEAASDEEVDKKAAEIVEDLLGHISKFVQARYELASGIIRGRSYAYVRGQRRRMKIAGTMAEWWVPHILKDIDKRRLHYKPSREPTKAGGFDVSQVLEYWSMRKNDWVEMTKEKRRALVVLTYQDREERLGYGEGLIVPIYHYFYAKGRIWQSSMEFLERYSQGIITAQVDPDRPGSVGKTNEEIVAEWHDVIDQMRARHALVYSKNDEMNIVEPSGSGANVGLDLMHYTDQCLTRLINGSIRPSGVDTETGARSQGEVEQETSDILISYDRELLDGALTEHLVRLVWEMNLPTLRGMGLGSAQMPKFATSQERREDPSEVATQVETLLRAGVHLSKSEVYERCGWRQPAKGEEILKAPEQPQAPGGAPGASPFGLAQFGEYEETKHKRDEGGKWATKEGTGGDEDYGGKEEKTATTFKSHKAAAKAFEGLGVVEAYIDDSSDIELVGKIYDGFARAKVEGSRMPLTLQAFPDKNRPGGYFAADEENIYINTDPDKLKKVTEAREARGGEVVPWVVSSSVDEVALHELGHLNHYHAMEDAEEDSWWELTGFDWDTGKQIETALPPEYSEVAIKYVSHYASSNPAEFVAEVYTGTMSGTKYPPEVESIYREYGGAPIKGFGGSK